MKGRHQGFSLVELIIVIAVASAVAAAALVWFQAEGRRAQRANALAIQAQEMAVLSRALSQYIREEPAFLQEGVAAPVGIESLVEANLLPADFGSRTSGLGPESPLGQSYLLTAMQDKGEGRGIVAATGEPNASVLSRLGIETETQLEDFQAAVTRQLKARHLLTAGLIKKGQAGADQNVSGFTYDFTSYLGLPVAAATAVSIVGFSELSQAPEVIVKVEGGSGGGSGGGTTGKDYAGWICRRTTDESCTSNEEEAVRYQMCKDYGQETASAMPDRERIGGSWGTIHLERWYSEPTTTFDMFTPPVLTTRPRYSSSQITSYRERCPSAGYNYTLTNYQSTANSGPAAGKTFVYWTKYDCEPNYDNGPNLLTYKESDLWDKGFASRILLAGSLVASSDYWPLAWGEHLRGAYQPSFSQVGSVPACPAQYAIDTPIFARDVLVETYRETMTSSTLRRDARLLAGGYRVVPQGTNSIKVGNRGAYFEKAIFDDGTAISNVCEEYYYTNQDQGRFPSSQVEFSGCPAVVESDAVDMDGTSHSGARPWQLFKVRPEAPAIRVCCRAP